MVSKEAVDQLQRAQKPGTRMSSLWYRFRETSCICLKKNLNGSRLSEHPPGRGENVKVVLAFFRKFVVILGSNGIGYQG